MTHQLPINPRISCRALSRVELEVPALNSGPGLTSLEVGEDTVALFSITQSLIPARDAGGEIIPLQQVHH